MSKLPYSNMLPSASRQLAADYANEFEQVFAGRFGTSKASTTPYPRVQFGGAKVEVYFSPQDGVAKHILQRLTAAKRGIHFMISSYTADSTAEAMIAKVKAGWWCAACSRRRTHTAAASISAG